MTQNSTDREADAIHDAMYPTAPRPTTNPVFMASAGDSEAEADRTYEAMYPGTPAARPSTHDALSNGVRTGRLYVDRTDWAAMAAARGL
jgi:hypothetical protein